jgi:serine/threonine protein kinase
MNGGFKRERTSNNNDATKKRKISCLNMNEDDIFEEFIKQLKQFQNDGFVEPSKDIRDIINTETKVKIGSGSFNKVYSYELNDKCSERNTSVLIRISKKPLVEDDNTDLIQSVKNICDMSKKDIHPKVYSIQLNSSGHLVVLMEPFESGNLSKYMKVLSESPNKEYIEDVHESIAKQCSSIIDKIVDNKLACLDIKPLNIVIKETPGESEPVKVRFIDFDADWCIPKKHIISKAMNTILNQIKVVEESDVVKLFLKLLLANHLYTYDKNNIMAPLLNRNYPTDTQNSTTILIKKFLFNSDETQKSIDAILTHYFYKYDKGYFKNYSEEFERDKIPPPKEKSQVKTIKEVFLIRGFVKNENDLRERKLTIGTRGDKKPLTRGKLKPYKIKIHRKTRRNSKNEKDLLKRKRRIAIRGDKKPITRRKSRKSTSSLGGKKTRRRKRN